MKTSYYALATGKAAPAIASERRTESKEGDEHDDSDDEDEDEDDHTFKTITEKPFEED